MHLRYLFFISLIISLALPNVTYAHVLKTDHTIGVVVHIEPDDDPFINEPSSIMFEFKDKEGKFNLDNCNCSLSVHTHNKELIAQPLYKGSNGLTSSTTVTFPEKNVYTLLIKGTPIKEGSFTPFSISYDIRVEREHTPSSNDTYQPNTFLYPILGIVVIPFMILLIKIIFKKKGGEQHEKTN